MRLYRIDYKINYESEALSLRSEPKVRVIRISKNDDDFSHSSLRSNGILISSYIIIDIDFMGSISKFHNYLLLKVKSFIRNNKIDELI